MKGLFIRPSNPTGSAYLKSFGFLPAPLGLLQLAADVMSLGKWEVRVLDMEADQIGVQEVLEVAESFDPDLIGITLHATAAHNTALRIAKGVKENSKEALLVAGGHHATFVPMEMLRGGFDVVVLGEGDLTIQEIAREVGEGRRDFSKIKGIVFNQGNRFVETPPAPLLRDLDLLPEPALELVKREKCRFDVFGKDNFVTCLETSRGCPYGCDFCSVTPTWGNKWRNKSNKRIMREIEKAKELGYNWVFFVDDIFVVWPNRSHREKLFREIIDRRIGIKFIAQMRADVTARNPDLVKMAAEAGLRVAFLGVESGSQETLRKMHKGIAVPDSIKAVKVLHQNGVIVLVGLIVGAPYEGFRELMATVRLSRELADAGADGVQFSVYTPLPGTRVFVNLLREGRILTLNWDYYDLLTPVLRTRVNPLIVQLLSLYANHSFYVRKYIKGKLGRGVRSQGDKARLLRQAEKYMWRRLPHFAQVTLVDFPLSLIKTLLLYVRRERLSQEVVSELISQSQRIVYEEADEKNRYFEVKED